MIDTEKVNRAVRACIRECFGTKVVLAEMASYLDERQKTEGWTASEIRLVESGVRRILKGVVTEERPGRETPGRKTA